MKRSFGLLWIAAIVLALASLAAGGPEKASSDKTRAKDSLYEQVGIFGDAISALREGYVEEVDSKKIIYGAMKGMLSSLDDYSQFMEPDEYREIQVETKGEFGGIGIEISMREGILTVITPLAGTPAEAAGLKPNDKVVKIDGKITKKLTLNEAVKLMRGKPGTPVTLTIWRDQDVFDVPIKRDIIKVNSIKKAELIEDKIGYIKLVEFQENTARDLDEALKKLEAQGMDSLILDLRNNPGGLLDGAIDVSERFLAKDMGIVSIKARNPQKAELFKSSGRFTRPDYPMVVLVNEGSASASEIVAGAVKDNRRGIILGAKTFGKASVQTVIPLKDGSALRFTTALYLTPGGRLIKEEGITPDVAVEEGAFEKKGKKDEAEEIFEKLEEDTAKKSVKEKPAEKPAAARDGQLEAAVNLMKAIKIYKAGSL